MQLFKKLKQEKLTQESKEKEKKLKKIEREENIKKWLKEYKKEEYFSPVNIKEFYIPSSKTFYYIESYITPYEASLLQTIINTQEESKWVHLHHSNRKLQKWGGNVTPEGLKNIEKIPEWLDILAQRLDSSKITDKEHYCNHYLLNHYQGASGIMPHTDGPLYHPYVTVLSIGSPVLFKIFEDFEKYKAEEELGNILVEGGSLLVFCDEFYHDFLHCIQDHKIDSLKADFRVKEIESGIEFEFIQSSVDNFLVTSLYKKFLKEVFEKINLEDSGGLEEYFLKLVYQDFKFSAKVNEGVLSLYVTWERKERISMTIRHVNPAPP